MSEPRKTFAERLDEAVDGKQFAATIMDLFSALDQARAAEEDAQGSS